MIRNLALPLLAACAFFPRAGIAQGFDREAFDLFVEARAGSGTSPVYWYSSGEVYSYPEGKLVLRIDGFDTARLLRSESEQDVAYQLSRKIFVYRDAATGRILTQYNGQPVTHIQYPYQYITYMLDGDRLVTFVEQGSGARLQKIGPGDKFIARRIGGSIVYSAPLFLNMETPAGRYEAYENYDFFIDPGAENTTDRCRLSWVRYGDLPRFVGAGKAVIQMVAYRVDRFEDLPASIREYVAGRARLWMEPPRNLEEIRSLQKDAP
ncbi:MAG: DUF1838 domain-containing protein [Acidobacteria bacterium]|nr:DUF1838 domain-containing protein [Acidobacteriota bacterium]